MTKEELEKEAEEYLKQKLEERKDKFVFELPEVYIEDVKEAYLAGAEPREKRIAELEAQIEKMKCCENCKYYNNHYNEVVCKRQVINCKRILRQATRDQWEIKEK